MPGSTHTTTSYLVFFFPENFFFLCLLPVPYACWRKQKNLEKAPTCLPRHSPRWQPSHCCLHLCEPQGEPGLHLAVVSLPATRRPGVMEMWVLSLSGKRQMPTLHQPPVPTWEHLGRSALEGSLLLLGFCCDGSHFYFHFLPPHNFTLGFSPVASCSALHTHTSGDGNILPHFIFQTKLSL